MQRVLVLQSAQDSIPHWQQRCLTSVHAWALAQGYDYRLLDDELFAEVPDWYLAKVGGRMAIAADLGRLQWAQRLLQEGYDWVLWFDADTLIFAPDQLTLTLQEDCLFGQEHWVQPKSPDSRQWQVRKNIHNAFAGFPKDCVVLPFLIKLILSMMGRVDPAHIAPQMMGPKLLSTLHNLADFDFLPEVGALSPAVLLDLQREPESTGPLAVMCQAQPKPLVAANLCASLVDRLNPDPSMAQQQIDKAIDRLLGCSAGLRSVDDVGA